MVQYDILLPIIKEILSSPSCQRISIYDMIQRTYDSYITIDKNPVDKELFTFLWLKTIRTKDELPIVTAIRRRLGFIKMGDLGDFYTGQYRDSPYTTFLEEYTKMLSIEDNSAYIKSTHKTSKIYYMYPISLHSCFDKISVTGDSSLKPFIAAYKFRHKCVYKYRGRYENLVMKKYKEKFANIHEHTIRVYHDHYAITVTRLYCTIELYDEAIESPLKDMINKWVPIIHEEVLSVNNCITYPNDCIDFHKFVENITGKYKIALVGIDQECIINIDNITINVNNTALLHSKRYDIGNDIVYRSAGERVLHFVCIMDISIKVFIDTISKLRKYMQQITDDEKIAIIRDPKRSNIDKLRTSNSAIFGRQYSKHCQPDYQPVVVLEENVQYHLNRGKMLLKYGDFYYTSKDPLFSNGYDYIGLKKDFTERNVLKPDKLIIRCYKKNHLLVEDQKELKSYLLRNSTMPDCGVIKREDIILPEHLQYLYNRHIFNKQRVESSIESKKIKTKGKHNIVSGKVPAQIGNILDDDQCIRIIGPGEGTKLLACLNIDPQHFLVYLREYKDLFDELKDQHICDIEQDILSGRVDHCLYGKAINSYLGISILVFSVTGLYPLPYSRISDTNLTILFLHDNIYEYIKLSKALSDEKITYLVDLHNKQVGLYMRKFYGRMLDHAKVYQDFTGALYNMLESMNIACVCKIISEEEAKNLLNIVYKAHIPSQNRLFISESIYKDLVVEHNISISSYDTAVKFLPRPELLCSIFPDILSKDGHIYTMLTLDDYTLYHPPNFTLENALYPNMDNYFRDRGEKLDIV